MHAPFDTLPGWAAAVACRLEFFARGQPRARQRRRALRRALRALRQHLAVVGDGAALAAFCHAALRLAEAGLAARPDLAAHRPGFGGLCALARAELAAGRDDRALVAAAQAAAALPVAMPWPLAALPGRVVFLASVADTLPDEAPAAAAMLANDLATLGHDLPCLALAAAAHPR
ncbi:hypothetical protein [Roseomonas sp. CECT 9278]|uniref:hypothetical protein n=1 Tax=Roseomonas sp. CECT 9278 TaxID=2845823 RepID=UPI001E43281C|nr:hypothetical protein [Roseomonas sp. CECT 9278]CAH0144844.1 hypothetical protein ROS9278_00567 [Roseomonas sp. CECT 9278]